LQDKVQQLAVVLDDLFSDYNVSPQEVLQALAKRKEDNIPLSAFKTKNLSSFEVIVKYLKENQGKKYSEIARLTNRNDRTIWSTYSHAISKCPHTLDISGPVFIPVFIFSKRDKSVLETLVIYLKETLGFSFKKIAILLSKNYQTIYTSYRRGSLK
jgi:hypothetical protein